MKIIHIKNMVCPRCINAVDLILKSEDVETESITLGEVVLKIALTSKQKNGVKNKLIKQGFELLVDSKSRIVSKIKSVIVTQTHQSSEALKINFSVFLSEQLNQDYTYLSKLFSSVEGITIEKYIVKQKIEKVKELMFYNEKSLSEIAYLMNYSSSAHLSNQFKKETGMTPSQFKKSKHPNHKSLDSL